MRRSEQQNKQQKKQRGDGERIKRFRCQKGIPAGGEQADYGDFLSQVTVANRGILSKLQP